MSNQAVGHRSGEKAARSGQLPEPLNEKTDEKFWEAKWGN